MQKFFLVISFFFTPIILFAQSEDLDGKLRAQEEQQKENDQKESKDSFKRTKHEKTKFKIDQKKKDPDGGGGNRGPRTPCQSAPRAPSGVQFLTKLTGFDPQPQRTMPKSSKGSNKIQQGIQQISSTEKKTW